MYSISINYETGNSFGGEIQTEEVGAIWASMDEAKQALLVIKKHYEAHQKINNYSNRGNVRWDDYKSESWFSSEHPEYAIIIKVDKKPCNLHCFWVGRFERLICASVVLSEEESEQRVYRP